MLTKIKDTYGEYNNGQDITIEVASGSYYEEVYIMGFIGSGQIVINLNSNAKVYGKWFIYDNTMMVFIKGNRTNMSTNDGAELFLIEEGYYGLFTVRNCHCKIEGIRSLNKCRPDSDGNKYGGAFVTLESAKVVVGNCDISRYYHGMLTYNTSIGNLTNCLGHVYYGAVARYGSYVGIANYPSEIETSWEDTGGTLKTTGIPYVSIYDYLYEGGSTTPTTPTTTPTVFNQSFVVTNLRTVPEGSGSSTSGKSDCIGQGKWGSYKPHRGYGDISSSLATFCSGATNISMTITMTRLSTSHGYSGSVPAPIFVYSGGTWDSATTFARGDTNTITLPSAIVEEIASGSMSSIQLWAGSSTEDYSFYNNVSINVTCTKSV